MLITSFVVNVIAFQASDPLTNHDALSGPGIPSNNTKFMLALKYGSQIGEDTRESKPFPERGEVVKTWTIESACVVRVSKKSSGRGWRT